MLVNIIAWQLPAIYAIGLLIALNQSNRSWRTARITSLVAMLTTLTVLVAALIWGSIANLSFDKVGLTMAMLVALLGWVIIDYASRYLSGEPGQQRFVRAMLITLTAVSALVVSRNLLTMVLAWSISSFSLHHLLTFYRDRKAAQVVAHKKFLVSRLAELALGVALVLVYQATGTLWLDELKIYLTEVDSLPMSLQAAATLFALAAVLKTAQLPLHGWLIQVMEAPTPVSALLHAGVVNIGGFVLIRLADLVSLAPMAQALLLVVGSLTAVLAGLVMLTRVSIKVRLAWSTCAQMGFMLMEIGLGLYELALLHLVAHSVYKAHAFLSAGDTVQQAKVSDLFESNQAASSLFRHLFMFSVSAFIVFGSTIIWQSQLPSLAVPGVALFIVSLGLSPLLWSVGRTSPLGWTFGCLQITLLAQLYLLWHVVFAQVAPATAAPGLTEVLWVLLCFSSFYATLAWLRCFPKGGFARRFYPWAYCGFYLDEKFTRLTFRLWPVKFSPAQAKTLTNREFNFQGETS